jgi:hypothetical protein
VPALAAALLLTLVAPAAAQSSAPRDELIRLVPDDVALCLVVNDLRTQGDKLMKSPWVKALKSSPFIKALGDAPEVLKLVEVQKQLQKHLQIDWAQLRDDILGDAVVFAYRPGPPDHPDKEQALVLLHARDPQLLAKLIERINLEQKKSGELKELKTREHQGAKYVQRIVAGRDQYYFLDGSFLAFTGQETMLQRMLERRADVKRPALPLARQLGDIGCNKALANVWINPRAFDTLLAAQAAELGTSLEGKSLKTFLTYWQALEGISLSLQVDSANPEIIVAVHARADRLPAPARKLVAESAKPSDVWARFPSDSVLTLAARTDFNALLETLEQLLPGDAEDGLTDLMQKSLGLPLNKELLKELAPNVGPDWGFCVAPAPDRKSFPHVLFALRLKSKPEQPQFEQALVSSLEILAGFAIKDYNKKHKDQIKLQKIKQDNVEVRYLVNDEKFPKGFQPAFALKDGYLVVASSPEALERFTKQTPLPPAGAVCPLLRLSFKHLGALVKDRRDLIMGFLTEKQKLGQQAAEHRYAALTWGLDLFDSAELVQRTDGDRVAWVFRLRTAGAEK